MRITQSMVVPEGASDDEAAIRQCPQCNRPQWFVPQSVMVLSPRGARKMRLWVCEVHPLPQHVTDQPEEKS